MIAARGIRRCRNAGFTLVEVIITAIFMAIIVALALSVWHDAGEAADQIALSADLQEKGKMLLDELGQVLTHGRVVDVSDQNDSIGIQVPIDDGSGNPFDAGGAIVWGQRSTTTGADTEFSRILYRAVAENSYDESADGVDYNRDGDRSDTLVRCRLEKVFQIDANQDPGNPQWQDQDSVVIDREVILNQNPSDGDVNGDGQADPLFFLTDEEGVERSSGGDRVRLRIWHGRIGREGFLYLRLATTEIYLRNS